MKFSDIDFGRIKAMMDNLNDDQKEEINQFAQNMMNNMNEAKDQEEEITFYEFLHIDEEEYKDCVVLDLIEQACDIEMYYEDTLEVDYSGCVLYYTKAILILCRQYLYPVYQELNVLNTSVSTTTLFSFLQPLMNEETIYLFVDENKTNSNTLISLRSFLQQSLMMLNRAEFDFVNYEDLQAFKQILFDQKNLLSIKEIFPE
ncbi:hypothetical protein [Floccifex sp.]|uniref:hypothetical protein n=1 Tax=Floccifex sp. TaxID=2815810 RepID=UPI003F0AA87E